VHYDYLRSAFNRNDDGWGLMRQGRKGPVIHRGMSTKFDDFLKIYSKFYEKFECAIHFRFATQGERNEANCHPYDLGNGVFMMHNGVITGLKEVDKSMSDTWHFGQLLTPYINAALAVAPEHVLEVVKKAIGMGNKLILMDKQRFYIVNQDQGSFDDGIWYSNTSMWTPPLHLSTNHGYYDKSGFHSYPDDYSDYNYETAKPTSQIMLPTTKEVVTFENGALKVPYTYGDYVEDETKKAEYKDWWKGALEEIGERAEAGELSYEDAIRMIEMTNGDYLQAIEQSPGHYQVCEPAPEVPVTWLDWSNLTETEMKLAAHLYTDELAKSFYRLLNFTVVRGKIPLGAPID
jgi:hypothetical protein